MSLKLSEILKEKPKSHQLIIETTPKGIEYACFIDLDNRVSRAWIKKDDAYEEIDVKTIVQKIAKYLAHHVTLEKLLQDKLCHAPLESLLDLEFRVDNNAEVKEHKGCYKLTIKGKKGFPMEMKLI